MRLIDGDAVKERLDNDISGMEERKKKVGSMFEKMEIMSQLSFARYVKVAIIGEPTVPAITLDRIEEAIDQINELDSQSIGFYEEANYLGASEYVCVDDVLEILNKLIAEVEGTNEAN